MREYRKRRHLSEDFLSDNGYSSYRDYLYDLIEDGHVDAKEIAQDLVYWVNERDIEHFMRVRYLIPDDND